MYFRDHNTQYLIKRTCISGITIHSTDVLIKSTVTCVITSVQTGHVLIKSTVTCVITSVQMGKEGQVCATCYREQYLLEDNTYYREQYLL